MKRIFLLGFAFLSSILCSNVFAAELSGSTFFVNTVDITYRSWSMDSYSVQVSIKMKYNINPGDRYVDEGYWSAIIIKKNGENYVVIDQNGSPSGIQGLGSKGQNGWFYGDTPRSRPYDMIPIFRADLAKDKYTIHGTFTYYDKSKEPEVFNEKLKLEDEDSIPVIFKFGHEKSTFLELFNEFVDWLPNPYIATSRDPIELSSGNMYINATDIKLPGVATGLELSRMYNSRDNFVGILGHGWRTNYDAYLSVDDYGNVKERNSSAALTCYMPKDDGNYHTFDGKRSLLFKNPDGTYVITRKRGEKQHFDTEGKIKRVVDPKGNTLDFAYDYLGQLESVTDAIGRQIKFKVTDGLLREVKDPLGRITGYSYDENNNLIKITDPAGNEVHYVYDANHNIIEMTNLNGNKTYYAYDENDRAYMNWQDGDKNKETLRFDNETQTTLIDANGNETIYQFNKYGITTKIIEADGATTEYVYNSDMNKEKIIYPDGKETIFTYDSNKNLASVTNSKNQTLSYTYDTRFNKVATVTDPLNNVTTYEYDAEGNLLKVTDALDNVTEYTYDEQGNCLTVKDARNNITSFEYDEFANLVKTTDALNNVTTITYDAAGNPLTVTDAKGNVTTNTYDVLNRLKEVAYPDTSSVSIDYDGFGNKVKATNALGLQTSFAYDNAERLITTTDPDNYTIVNSYDLFGNPLSVTDQNGNVTTLVYDNKNRLKEEINALDQKTVYEYDLFDRVVSKTDANNNIITYVYDELGNLTETNYPDASTIIYTYDELNRRATMVDSLGTTTYSYDKLSRILSIDGPADNDTISYTYDAIGNKSTMTDQDGQLTVYSYDELNRLKTVTQDSNVTTYTYDQLGNVTNIAYPNGTTVENTYNNMNRLVSHINKDSSNVVISSYVLEYNKAGMIVKKTLANGTWIEYGYDTLNRLVRETKKMQIGVAASTNLSEQIYEYDPSGNRTSLIDNTSVEKFWTYNANEFNSDVKQNLIDAGFGTGTGDLPLAIKKSYVYNKANQLNTWSHDIAVSASMVNVDTGSYAYDNNGNRTNMTTVAVGQANNALVDFVYDYENRLIQVDKLDETVKYAYDGTGKRVSREWIDTTDPVNPVASEYANYLYDGLNVILEKDSADKTQLSYLRAPGYAGGIAGIISLAEYNYSGETLDSKTLSYYHYDNLGSVANMTNSSGAVVNVAANKYTFSTKEYDPITGLHYFGARYYDNQIGRWLTPDPMGFIDGPNLYAYVQNNPINFVDPHGYMTEKKGLAIGFAGNLSWLCPFFSDGGHVVGVNPMYFWNENEAKNYVYDSKDGENFGFDFGAGAEVVLAWGSGDWSGDFKSFNGSYGPVVFSVFASPDFSWVGITMGPGAGLPGAAYEETEYKEYYGKGIL